MEEISSSANLSQTVRVISGSLPRHTDALNVADVVDEALAFVRDGPARR